MKKVDVIQIVKTTVQCDNPECGWSIEANPPDWLNKKCPKCGISVIITEEDLKIFHAVRALKKAFGQTETVNDEEPKYETVKIDTSVLRKNNL